MKRVGLDLTFDPDTRMVVSGFVVFSIDLLACIGVLWLRRHPRIHRLSPRMLACSQFMAFLWFLTLSLNDRLTHLWDSLGWTCWVAQLTVRVLFFTGYVSALLSRHYVVYSRWLSVDRYGRSLLLLNGVVFILAAALVGVGVSIGPDSDAPTNSSNQQCHMSGETSLLLLLFQGLLLLLVCGMAVMLARTVYLDTRADYALLHPKALNALIDMAAVVCMTLAYPIVYHGNPAKPTNGLDNSFVVVTAVVLPCLMFWTQVLPAWFGVGQQLPEMSFFPSQVFDHSTGAFTSNVEHLPKLRRVLADDRQKLKPDRSINDASPIPVHDTERLFDLIIAGEVDECRHLLLERGVDLLGVPGPNGETALHVAVGHPELSQHTRLEMVELLVDMKASLGAQNNEGRTPLHIAATLSDPQLVCFMVQSAMKSAKFGEASNPHMTSLINVIANDGATPLHIATKLDDMGTLTTLLGLGADPSRCAPSRTQVKVEDWDGAYDAQVGEIAHGKSSFMVACEIGSLLTVQQMLISSPRSCDIEQLSPFGMTPLMTACMLRHPKLAMYLLKQGANVWHTMPSSRPSRGLTVLHCCAIGGDPATLHAVVRELVSGTHMPIGTDTDTYERCTSISESDISQSTGTQQQQDQSSMYAHSPNAKLPETPVLAARSPTSTVQLLDRSIQLSEQYLADSLPRVGSAFFSSQPRTSVTFETRPPTYDDATATTPPPPTDDDIRAAITVLAARGELEPLPAERGLLAALEDFWEGIPRDTTVDQRKLSVERAVATALQTPGVCSDHLIRVLSEDAYKWTGSRFAVPLTAPKAKQLAASLRRVLNPTIDLANVARCEGRLLLQAQSLRDDEKDKILRALDTLARHREHDGSGGGGGSSGGPKKLFTSSTSSRGSNTPGSPKAPPAGSRTSAGPQDHLEGSLSREGGGGGGGDNSFTDSDSIPLNVHRYLNRSDCWARTALHWAVLRRNVGVVFSLVMYGCIAAIRDRKSRRRSDILGLTSLQYAEKLSLAGHSGPYVAIAEAEALKARTRTRTSTSLRVDDVTSKALVR